MLKIHNIHKRFDDKEVLRGVSLELKKGEIYGLIGKNGAGKTTLMKIIMGLMTKTNGEIYQTQENNKAIVYGYLTDVPSFFDHLSAGEYLDYLLKEKNSRLTYDFLEMANLEYKERIKGMSRGMKQRLGIVTALVNHPDILVLDEPTSALDPGGRYEVLNMLLKLKKEGKTVLLSTHILNDMQTICDRVGFLSEGIIKRELTINKLLNDKLSLRILFSGPIEIDGINTICDSYEKIEDNEYIYRGISLNNQSSFFRFLSDSKSYVVQIKSELPQLEEVFHEVCE